MKTIKQISKIILISLFLFGTVNSSIADEIKDKFEKTFKLSKTGELTFSCYDTDLKINTWDKDEVKLAGEIIISGGNPDDQQKLIDVFKNPDISESTNTLSIKTDLAKNTLIIGPFKKITLVDGKTIRVDKYKASYTLWIPESVALNLKSKYNDIDIATLTGQLDFDLYEVDLTLVNFENGDFKMKYSSAEIGKGENAKFDVYECEIVIKDIKIFLIDTKYSEFNIENAGMIAVDSYEDKFKIKNLTDGLTGQAKYSNFDIESNTEFIEINVYETEIKVLNINKLEYSSKYSTLNAQNIGFAKCESLYEAKIHAAIVGEFSCRESKYDDINFQAITKSIDISSAYELKLDVETVKPSFESFYGDFKYGYVNLPLDSAIEFTLDFDITYGDVDFPKDRIRVKDFNIKESSKHSFEGATSENAKCKIKFKGYDANFNLE